MTLRLVNEQALWGNLTAVMFDSAFGRVHGPGAWTLPLPIAGACAASASSLLRAIQPTHLPLPHPRRCRPLPLGTWPQAGAASRQDGEVHDRAAPRPDGQDAQHPEHERHRARCADACHMLALCYARLCTTEGLPLTAPHACMPAVDHGKSTLTDSLVAAAGIIAMETVRRIA